MQSLVTEISFTFFHELGVVIEQHQFAMSRVTHYLCQQSDSCRFLTYLDSIGVGVE